MLVAFITGNSSLEPLIEGLYAQIHVNLRHYNNVWHTVTRCNTLQHCDTLEHTATHCNTLQHTATHCNTHKAEANERCEWNCSCSNTQMSNVKRQSWCPHLPHCITYDHSYVTCYTLLHTAIQLHTAPHCNTKHTTTHCNTLQHAAEQNNENFDRKN